MCSGSLAPNTRVIEPILINFDQRADVVIRHPGAFTAEQLEYVLDSLVPPATK